MYGAPGEPSRLSAGAAGVAVGPTWSEPQPVPTRSYADHVAGFEGPGERRDPSQAPKLPSWAVTSRSSEPEPGPGDSGTPGTTRSPAADPPGVADLGRGAPSRGQRAEPPVVRVPEHPFDVDDPFGDNQLGGSSSPWIRPPADDSEVRVVDLADEFHLTTAQALEVCEASGTPATSGAVWLTVEQADAFRAAVVHVDRTEGGDSGGFPSWAVPPGGRPGTPPASAPVAPPPVRDQTPPAAPAVPPAADGTTRATGDDADADQGGRGSLTLRLVLVAVAILAVVAVAAALLVR